MASSDHQFSPIESYWTAEKVRSARPQPDIGRLRKMAAETQTLNGSEILEYWTPERIKQAKPESGLRFFSPQRRTIEVDSDAPMAAGPINIVSDDRLTTFPYQSVGKLLYTKSGVDLAGSAFVVNVGDAKNVVFTAAHCLDTLSGKAANILFIPAMVDINDVSGQLYGHFPQIPGGKGVAWAVNINWDPNNMKEQFDNGAVKLLPRSDGKNVGDVVTPLTVLADQQYNASSSWNTIGYPGLCPQDPNGKMAEREGTLKECSDNIVYKYGGMLQGMSGGPWILGGSGGKVNGNQSTTDEVDDVAKSPYYTASSHSALLKTLGCQ